MANESTFIIEEADPTFVRFLDESRFWIQRILLLIIGIVGIVGNIATIPVLTRRGMRTPTNAYLTALAVADLIYLICVLWLSLRHYSFVNENPFWSFIYSHVWPYCLYLADATTNTSVWLTVAFAMERCIAIAYPIKGRVLCTVSRAKKMIIGVYCVCFGATMTTLFEWTVEEKATDSAANESIFEIASSELGKNKTYQTIYYWFTSMLLPFTLLIIFNSFLIHSFHQSKKLRRALTARQSVSQDAKRAASREIKITSTLITVVVIFLVCQLPTAATLIYKISRVTALTPNEEAVLRALGNIFNCLVALNAACNFILYSVISQKYRRAFMSTFFCCLCRKPSSVHLKTYNIHQVEGPKGFRSPSPRRSSSSSASRNHSLGPLNNFTASSKGVSARRPRRMSSAPFTNRRKTDLVTPSCISDNGFSPDIFSKSNPVHHTEIFSIFRPLKSAVPSNHQSKKLPIIRTYSTVLKNKFIDSPLFLKYSSWPNIWLFKKPTISSKIPIQMSNTRKFSATPFSV